ncbi:MAG: PDZ domain-containing protein [Aureliella sp.]
MRVPHQLLTLGLIGLATVGAARLLPEARYGNAPQWQSAHSGLADRGLADRGLAVAGDEASSDEASDDQWASSESDQSHILVQEPSRRRSQRPQLGNPLHNINQRSSFQMLRAFRDAIGNSWKSTVEVMVDDERVAFGAIIDRDGWIVTKDSQIPSKGKVVCRFADGNESLAEAVKRNSAIDLVLLRVPDRNLPVIEWGDDAVPQRGRWVATTDTRSTPVAVGVVSAGRMAIAPKKAVLGVLLENADEGGAMIRNVLPGTGAELAGLRVGDRIRAINGQLLANRQAAMSVLESCLAGQSIKLAVVRGEDELETYAQMMDLAHELLDPTEMEVNGLVSARSSGFNAVFLHDTVLLPTQCGGPLVDLNGRVVGINIARAGRVTSYALPTATVRPEIERMLSEAKGSQVVPANASVSAASAEVR